MMFSWATPEYLLDQMSLSQVIFYYNMAWESKQTEAKVLWGVLGQLLENKKEKHGMTDDEVKLYYPDAIKINGKWILEPNKEGSCLSEKSQSQLPETSQS